SKRGRPKAPTLSEARKRALATWRPTQTATPRTCRSSSARAPPPNASAGAQKYRPPWFFGGLHDHLGSLDLTRILAGHHGDYSGMARSETQAFPRQRFREAAQAIGKSGSHVLDSAVCRETPLEQVGYALGWATGPI